MSRDSCYIYQAALYCDDCGRDLVAKLPVPEGADLENEHTWDSDVYPKGPFPTDESDTPQHCDACGDLLRHDLTADGEKYVREAFREAKRAGREPMAEWIEQWPDLECHATKEILEMLGSSAALPKYTSVGSYPLFYLTHHDDVLCRDCATADIDNVVNVGVNYEDPSLDCDECNERIESAYAEPEET